MERSIPSWDFPLLSLRMPWATGPPGSTCVCDASRAPQRPQPCVAAAVSRKSPPHVDPLERDELTALLTKVTATMDADDALRVLILARTGMRPGEVAALRVGDAF